MIFTLYHLREWICPEGHESYRNVPDENRTPEQRLYSELHSLHEYQVVRDLCNNAKHFEGRGEERDMLVLEGARAGYMRAGDRLGVTHFVVDGREIRDYVHVILTRYREYFEQAQ